MPLSATAVTATFLLVFFLLNRRHLTALAVTLVGLSLYGSSVFPVDQFKLQLGTLNGKDWRAEAIQLNIRWSDGPKVSYSLSAARFVHTALSFPLLSPEIQCDRGVIDDDLVSCEQGHLKAVNPLLDNDVFPLEFRWERAAHRFSFAVEQLRLAGGSVKLRLDAAALDWKVKIAGESVLLQRLRSVLATLDMALPEFKLEGRANLDLNLGGGETVRSANWKLKFRQVAFSDAKGGYIGEGLSGDWSGSMDASIQGYAGSTKLALEQGALLTPFVYLEPEGNAINIGMNYRFNHALSNMSVTQLEYRDPKVIMLSAEGSLTLTPDLRIESFRIHSQPTELDKLYRRYFQPVLADELFETLNLHGGARFEFQLDSVSTLRLKLNDISVHQGSTVADGVGENFRVSGLGGDLIWSSGDRVPESRLHWRDGSLLQRITIGSGEAHLKLRGNRLQLAEPVSLPVLDGALQAEHFSVNLAESGSRVDFRGYITPISMKLISEALGWPPLAGRLSAMIPGVAYEEGLLKLRGMTLIRAFDGTILLKNLQLDDIFGPLPVLQADVELKALDLETLTSTFSFGKITGRLAGQVNRLRLEKWQPVAFDAWFATPENDPGPHRISQKAVDNISNLGGVGISGALSRSFLRFFEEFGYEKLGISCRLENRVCEMGGVESAGQAQGYYLVKGGGLPRIDIVGFNRKTDWSLLVDKLKQVAEGGTPIIQ
ncbi:MAG: hypothetical protein H6968_18915 [Chromatiaceae bacterium]|nr:hypothetical protein [Chromatiaceae bacterium]